MKEFVHQISDLGEVRLHYVTAGQGEPVVLLHGWPQTWYCWRKVIPLLAERYQVIVPDLPGLGDSSASPTGYSKRALADHIRQLLVDELELTAVHAVGHDWGGVVAYSLAAHHPSLVSTLTVVDVAIPGGGGTDIAQGGRRWHHGFHRTPDLPEALISGREELYLRWFYDNFGHKPGVISDSEVAEYLRAYSRPEVLRAGFDLYRATAQDIEDNQDVAARGPLDLPALAVGGRSSWGRGSEVAAALRGLVGEVREVLVPNAGHWVPEEQPEFLADTVLSFIADHEAVRG